MSDKFKLVDRQVIPCDDLLKWAEWFENSERRIKVTKLDDALISTVFLGIDHQ